MAKRNKINRSEPNTPTKIRKRVDNELRRSEAYLAQAQRLTRTGNWVLNLSSRQSFWSLEFFRILDLDPARTKPSFSAFLERVHPEDRLVVEQTMDRGIREGHDFEHDYRLMLSDGLIKHIHAVLHPIAGMSGKIRDVMGTVADISDRVQAESELRRSEALLVEAEKISHTGCWARNPTSGTLFWSQEEWRIFGLDPKTTKLSYAMFLQMIHPEDRSLVEETSKQAVKEKKPYDIPFRIVLPDRSIKHIHSVGQPFFEASGDVVEYIGVSMDETERKRDEEALRESEAKFRGYAETASDWFWEIGPDYKFTLLTENAFGSDAAGRIGTACWDHALDLETEPEKWRVVRETLDARKPFRDFVYRSVSGNGTPIYVKASGKPVFDTKGEFLGYRGTGTDVTATMRAREEHERLRQLESELAHMNRLGIIGEQAASLVHEITQPIATARNNARAALNFLDRQPPELGEVREALACVVGDADRAGEVIDRIRDHIRKAPPRKTSFDLNDAIDEVIVLGRSAIANNKVLVQTCFADGLFPVQGDRVQLQQVILNLVLNAVEAMGAVEAGPRELLIGTEQTEGNGVLVEVRDSGPGIDPEDRERVFQAFYTTKSTGVGIGLSICRSIIEAHGGRLWADANETPGAVFQFTLPNAETS